MPDDGAATNIPTTDSARFASPQENDASTEGGRFTAPEQEGTQRPAPRRAPRARRITVSEEIVRPLNDHHHKLESYVKGFLLFRDLSNRSGRIRSAVEDPNRWAMPWQLRDDVRDDLEGIRADFQIHEMWTEEFGPQLTEFRGGLDDLTALLVDQGGPFGGGEPDEVEARPRMSMQMNRMMTAATTIEGQCRSKCQDELDELGRYVKNIFDQLQRRPVGGTSGDNEKRSVDLVPHEEPTNQVGEFARPRSADTTNVTAGSATEGGD